MPFYRHRNSGALATVDDGDTATYDADPHWVNVDPAEPRPLKTKAKQLDPEPPPAAA